MGCAGAVSYTHLHPKLRDVPFYLEAPDATLKEYGEAIGKFQKARASA